MEQKETAPKNVFRPKDSVEAAAKLKEGIPIEIVDTHAFKAIAVFEQIKLGSYSMVLSRWNDGWAGFKPGF